MNRPAIIARLGIFLFCSAPLVRAQQINPRVPPPPPAQPPAASAPVASSSGSPDSSASSGSASAPGSGAAPAASSAPAKPIDTSMPPPPPPEESAEDADPAPSGPVFDPLHAQRSLDIGTFYMKKGSYDAAIERFIEAANYQPSLAAPWKLLGETYEKKREYSKAVDAYNKYLRILPHAADAAKIQKTISELQEKASSESAAH